MFARPPMAVATALCVCALVFISCILVVSGSGPTGLTSSHSTTHGTEHEKASQSVVSGHEHAREHAHGSQEETHKHHGATQGGEEDLRRRNTPKVKPQSRVTDCPNKSYNFEPEYNYCGAGYFTTDTYTSPAPVSGSTWSLSSVQLITRHGDRTPVNILPVYDVAFPFCETPQTLGFYAFGAQGQQQQQETAGERGSIKSHKHKRRRTAAPNEGRRLERIPVLSTASVANPFAGELWQGNCMTGQLTTTGIQQLIEIGQNLREIYVETLGFLPSSYSRVNTSFYLRTTDVWRTRQSAESLLTGLWPTQGLDDEVIPLHSFPQEIETMYANTLACDALAEVQTQQFESDEWMAHLNNYPDVWATLNEVLGTGNLSDWHQAYDHYYDNFKTRECHGLPLPCQPGNPSNCIPESVAQFVYGMGDWEYQYLMINSTLAPQLAQYGIGAFMSVIRDVMLAKITGDPSKSTIGSPDFAYYSGHDTTVGAVLGALNVTGFRWPPYASNMLFELWLSTPTTSASSEEKDDAIPPEQNYSVRVLYNGAVLPMYAAGCCTDLCPVEQFIDYLNTVIPQNLVEICTGDGLRKKIH